MRGPWCSKRHRNNRNRRLPIPRDGSGHFSVPVGTDGITDQTIDSGRYNAFVHDVETDLNVPRPITAGGTGANNAADAMVALSGEFANQGPVTNYDTFPFKSGSFWSLPGATAAPSGSHCEGICYTQAIADNFYLEARDLATNVKWVRRKVNDVWQAWARDDQLALDNSNLKVAKAGDVMTGPLTINAAWAEFALNKPASGTANVLGGRNNGLPRWQILIGDHAAEAGANVGSDFSIARFSDAGSYIDNPLSITRWDGRVYNNGAVPTAPSELANKGYVDTQISSITTGVNAKVSRSGDTMTGDLEIAKSYPNIWLNKTAVAQNSILRGALNGVTRWAVDVADNVAEGGGNSGSNFSIYNYSDAGAFMGAAFTIFRASGNVGIGMTPGVKLDVNGTIRSNAPVALALGPDAAIRDATNGASGMYFDVSTGGAAHGSFVFRSSNAYTAFVNITASAMIVNVPVFINGAAGANTVLYLNDEAATPKGIIFWERSTNIIKLMTPSPAFYELSIDANNGQCKLGRGFCGRAGKSGPYQTDNKPQNSYWNGSANQMWVDDANLGNFSTTCDYRIKKDVVPLASTWQAVKALNPIVYTQAEFTPTSAIAAAHELGVNATPLFFDDDVPRWGFIAHELQKTLLPSAASGYKDSPVDIQSPNLLAIVAALTRALQEAMARIEDLETRR